MFDSNGKLLIIPYGMAGVPAALAEAMQSGEAERLSRPGSPVAVIDLRAETRLKLHGVGHPFTRPPQAADLAHAGSQLAFLEDHLSTLCGFRERPKRQFIAAYFAAVRDHVRAHAQELEARTGALAGLCEPQHWCFSALMPLPRAHLYLPEEPASAAIHVKDFVGVDFASWDGRELTVVFIDTGNTPTPMQKAARLRLRRPGVRICDLPAKALLRSEGDALLAKLGSGFKHFWHGDPIPLSPFRGGSVADPIPAPPKSPSN